MFLGICRASLLALRIKSDAVWHPSQVRIRSDPKDWPQKAASLRVEAGQKPVLAAKLAGGLKVGGAFGDGKEQDATYGAVDQEEMTEYEQKRAANIQRNKQARDHQ